MALTFVHTADWHLGHTYWRIGPKAPQSLQWRFEAVRRIWNLAAERKADFILVAGDVFDSDTPSASCRNAAVELLADAPAPVYLISGNHDPSAEGSVWFQADFAGALEGLSNVRLALKSEPLEIGQGVRLFPCPVKRKHARQDASAWIPDGDRGGDYRIGLAHGIWKGYSGPAQDDGFNIIDSACSERAGLDYLALGDFHSYTPHDHRAARARAFYAGTPEVGARDNVRAGHALVVSLDSPGAALGVEACFVGRIKLVNWGRVSLHADRDIDALESKKLEIEDPGHTLVRAEFYGSLSPSLLARLQTLLNEWREELLGIDASTAGLQMRPQAEDFQQLKLERVEEAVLDALQQPLPEDLMSALKSGDRLVEWGRDEAARAEALSLFYRLLREGTR